MAKPSGFMLKMQQKNEQAMHKYVCVALQQSEDAAVIALNRAFGFGTERAVRFRNELHKVLAEYAADYQKDAKEDKKMDYAKGCNDRELKRVLGDSLREWEERYPY